MKEIMELAVKISEAINVTTRHVDTLLHSNYVGVHKPGLFASNPSMAKNLKEIHGQLQIIGASVAENIGAVERVERADIPRKDENITRS